MSKGFDVMEWLKGQIGRKRADVLIDLKALTKETRQAVVEANRGRTSMQQRAVISTASKNDARIGRFFVYAQRLEKRPMATSVADWALYRQITEAWVETGCVKPEVLKLFDK